MLVLVKEKDESPIHINNSLFNIFFVQLIFPSVVLLTLICCLLSVVCCLFSVLNPRILEADQLTTYNLQLYIFIFVVIVLIVVITIMIVV